MIGVVAKDEKEVVVVVVEDSLKQTWEAALLLKQALCHTRPPRRSITLQQPAALAKSALSHHQHAARIRMTIASAVIVAMRTRLRCLHLLNPILLPTRPQLDVEETEQEEECLQTPPRSRLSVTDFLLAGT